MSNLTLTIDYQTKICTNWSDKLIKYGKTRNGYPPEFSSIS